MPYKTGIRLLGVARNPANGFPARLLGMTVANTLDRASLVAPELMDAEVLSVLRRAVLNGVLEEARAEMAVEDMAHWPVDRISHQSLAALAW